LIRHHQEEKYTKADNNNNFHPCHHCYQLYLPAQLQDRVCRDNVQCAANTARVKKLDLRNKNIAGNLDLTNLVSLTKLDCSQNEITSLILPKNIQELNCEVNKLTSLNLSNCPRLTYLDCRINKLSSLHLSQQNELTKLNCIENEKLIDLTLPTKLRSTKLSVESN
jgi:Leucine-rich repeat (LRR) protein